jgi:hypothetical protein
MPGTIIVEAISTNRRDISIEYSSDPEDYLTYFAKID